MGTNSSMSGLILRPKHSNFEVYFDCYGRANEPSQYGFFVENDKLHISEIDVEYGRVYRLKHIYDCKATDQRNVLTTVKKELIQ